MILVDTPVGKDLELIVDESAGTLTVEVKGTVLGQPEDVKIKLNLLDVLAPLEAGISNPFAKWALGLLLAIL